MTFEEITKEMNELYERKNRDYGNSFDDSLDKFGVIAAIVRMNDKMNRINSIYNKNPEVEEKLEETVIDLANYAVMTLKWLRNKR